MRLHILYNEYRPEEIAQFIHVRRLCLIFFFGYTHMCICIEIAFIDTAFALIIWQQLRSFERFVCNKFEMSCRFIHFYSAFDGYNAHGAMQIFNRLDSVSRCYINVKNKWKKPKREWVKSSPKKKNSNFFIVHWFYSFMAPFLCSVVFFFFKRTFCFIRIKRNLMLENVTNTKAFRLSRVHCATQPEYVCYTFYTRHVRNVQRNIENHNYKYILWTI